MPRRLLCLASVWVACAVSFGAGCAKRHPLESNVPTTVYLAKRVRTMDAGRPTAEAFAVRDGRVLRVGTKKAVLDAVGPSAQVVEWKDAVVVPGLTDAHAHLLGLGTALSTLNLVGAKSIDEVLARAKAAGPESLQGDWLLGRGWDQNDWSGKERALPTKARLDAAFPDRPVVLTRVDGHAIWVNSAALKAAGIDRKSKDPVGGRIVRGKKGEPTGVLVDNAMALVRSKVPPLTLEQRAARLQAALRRCVEVGLTGIHDAGMELATFKQLQQWDLLALLPIRIYAMADGQGPDADAYLGQGPFQGRLLTMRAAKLLADGALGSRGAALFEPYSDEKGQSGFLLMTEEDFAARAGAFAERGFQVAVHAIGDKANAVTIDVLSELEKRKPGSRHRVEHAQVLRRGDIERLAKGGLLASMQPTHCTSDMPWAPARLGPERVKGAYAWKSLLQAGAPLAFGSDFPVEAPTVLSGLYAARTRQSASGEPQEGWLPEERLSGEETLAAFTTGAAYAAFAEKERGQLKEGMDADFVVLSADPVEDAPAALLEAKVLATVVEGRVVYQAPR